jgi:hypothetical protein
MINGINVRSWHEADRLKRQEVHSERGADLEWIIIGLTAHIEAGFLKISIDFRIVEGWKFGFLGCRFYRFAIGFIAVAG